MPMLGRLDAAENDTALDGFVVIKLNGGLATSMGLQEPKSLIEAKDGHSFLDIIIGQTIALRERYGVGLPLLLMNSEATREATLQRAGSHPELRVEGIAADFLQSMVPKLEATRCRRQLAPGADAGVGPARTRRHLWLAAKLGHAATRCWSAASATR